MKVKLKKMMKTDYKLSRLEVPSKNENNLQPVERLIVVWTTWHERRLHRDN